MAVGEGKSEVVRYRGKVPGKRGTHLGVQLEGPHGDPLGGAAGGAAWGLCQVNIRRLQVL